MPGEVSGSIRVFSGDDSAEFYSTVFTIVAVSRRSTSSNSYSGDSFGNDYLLETKLSDLIAIKSTHTP
jgi:hypothetical protein